MHKPFKYATQCRKNAKFFKLIHLVFSGLTEKFSIQTVLINKIIQANNLSYLVRNQIEIICFVYHSIFVKNIAFLGLKMNYYLSRVFLNVKYEPSIITSKVI